MIENMRGSLSCSNPGVVPKPNQPELNHHQADQQHRVHPAQALGSLIYPDLKSEEGGYGDDGQTQPDIAPVPVGRLQRPGGIKTVEDVDRAAEFGDQTPAERLAAQAPTRKRLFGMADDEIVRAPNLAHRAQPVPI